MSALRDAFQKAQQDSLQLSARPDNVTLLKLYALYKQATEGDAGGQRPGFSDMVGRAKWDAWHSLAGTDAGDAMQQYVDLIEELKEA